MLKITIFDFLQSYNTTLSFNMKKVTLSFKTQADLKRFHSLIGEAAFEFNISEMTITCKCDEREIELAVNAFNAKILATDEKSVF